MIILADLSIFPIGKGESVSEYVARAVEIIRKSGLSHRFGPMGTCVEGEYGQVMAVVKECLDALDADCDRVYANVKIDWRKDRLNALDEKVRSVEKRLAG